MNRYNKNIEPLPPGESTYMKAYFDKMVSSGLPPVMKRSHLAGQEDNLWDFIPPDKDWGSMVVIKSISRKSGQYFIAAEDGKYHHATNYSRLSDREIRDLKLKILLEND